MWYQVCVKLFFFFNVAVEALTIPPIPSLVSPTPEFSALEQESQAWGIKCRLPDWVSSCPLSASPSSFR